MIYALLLLAAAFLTVATCYVALIHLDKLRKQGKPLEFWTSCLFVPGVVGWVVDVVLMNWLVATVAYLEWPHELTFSSRIQRKHLRELASGNLRKFTSFWVARLNEIDDSPHIHGLES